MFKSPKTYDLCSLLSYLHSLQLDLFPVMSKLVQIHDQQQSLVWLERLNGLLQMSFTGDQ